MSQQVLDKPGASVTSTRHSTRPWLFLYAGLSLATLLLGGLLTGIGMGKWYDNLRVPDWQPPGWAFSPAWTFILTLLAIATWRISTLGAPGKGKQIALGLYGLQLVLNLCWSLFFFALHSPEWALVDIIILNVVLIAMVITYWNQSPLAGMLLLPYSGWVLFATAINVWIVIHN